MPPYPSGMRLPNIYDTQNHTNQYLFFRFLYDVANTVTWAFYIILLLRASNNSIEVVFLNAAGYNTGIVIGFFLSSYLLSKLGYLNSFRISNVLLLGCTIITLVTLPYLLELHIVLAIMRGIAKSFFFAPSNMYNLKEVHGTTRSQLINLIISVDYIIGIVLPVVVGGSIVAYGYTWIFIIGIVLYTIGAVYHWGGNLKPKDALKFSDLKPLSRKKGFKRWTAIVVLAEFLAELQVDALAIIPFLFLGNEFNVGVFASAMGFLAAFMTFAHRKDGLAHKIRNGYFGAWFIGAANLIFSVVWTMPAMVIRGTAVTAGNAFYDPPSQDLSYRNKELVLGNFMSESAVELDLYLEVIYYGARISAAIFVSFLLIVIKANPDSVLRLIMFVTAFNGIALLSLNRWVNNVLRFSGFRHSPAPVANAPLSVNRI